MLLVQVWQCPAHSAARGEGAGRCHVYRVRYDLEMGRYLVAVRSWVNLLSLNSLELLIARQILGIFIKNSVKIGMKRKNMLRAK